MLIYKAGTNKITLRGTDYIADENGIIDVPDDKIDSSVWASGFVSARGRLQELEATKPAVPEALTTAVSVLEPIASVDQEPKPADKRTSRS